MVGEIDDVAARGVPTDEIGLLSIDADGHIDRHLAHFFDLVLPDGIIVLDDYRDYVDSQGRKTIEACRFVRARGPPALRRPSAPRDRLPR